MKLISWNVNGLRACVQKGFLDCRDAQKNMLCIARRASRSKNVEGILK